MSQIQPLDYSIEAQPRAAGEDRLGPRWGLAAAGAGLGALAAAIAVLSAGLSANSPVGWLAVGCAAAIGAVLGA